MHAQAIERSLILSVSKRLLCARRNAFCARVLKIKKINGAQPSAHHRSKQLSALIISVNSKRSKKLRLQGQQILSSAVKMLRNVLKKIKLVRSLINITPSF